MSIGRVYFILILNSKISEENEMITYEPLYRTMKERGISTYRLIQEYGISRSLLDRLKHNKPISTVTLNDLCTILSCRVEDVLLFREDEPVTR